MARRKQRQRSPSRTPRIPDRGAPTDPLNQAGRPQVPGDAKLVDEFTRSSLRKATVWSVTLKVVGIVLVFDPAGLNVVDFPKALFSRMTEWLLAGLLVLVFVRFGRRAFPLTRLYLLVIGVLLACVLSTLFADNKYAALYGEGDRYLGLAFIGDMAVMYLSIVVTFRTTKDFTLLAGGLAAALLGTAAYAGVQIAGKDPLHWAYTARAFSTLGNPDFFASFLSSALAGAAAVAALASARPQRSLRLFAGSLVVIALVVTAFVATRGSLLGISAGLLAVAACYVRLRGVVAVPKRAAVAWSVLALVVLAAILTVTPLGARARATLSGVNVADRVLIWDSALHAIEERPLLGFGPDNFGVAYRRYRQPGSAEIFGYGVLQTSAHDWILQAGATTGLLGLGALLVLIGSTAYMLWRHGLQRAPLVAAPCLAAMAAFYAEQLVTPNGTGIDWIPWLAFAAAPALLVQRDRLGVARRNPPLLQPLLVLPALVLAATGTSAFQANRDAASAQRATDAKDGVAAVAAARSATQLDPGRAEYWLRLGLAYEIGQDWHAAGDAYAHAAARQPYDATNWSNLAAVRTNQTTRHDESSGGADAALAAAQRGVDVDPNNPAPHRVYSDVANALGFYDLALREIGQAIRLYRLDAEFDIRAAQAAMRAADKTAARSELEALLALKDTATLRVAAAQLALDQHDTTAAAMHARRALELEPSNQDAQRILAAATAG